MLPKSKLGYRTHDKPTMPYAIQQMYHHKIEALLAIPKFIQNGFEKPRTLKLNTTAYQSWQTFQKEIEIQLRPEGKLAICQGWGGKICGFALRIPGLLHVAEIGDQHLVIEEDAMDKAIIIANLLIEHAIAAFALMGMDQETEDAKAVFRWVIANNKPLFSQSEIVLAMRNKKFAKAERLTKALTVLMERNLLEARKLATRKPTTLYYVHPAILSDSV